MPNRLPEYHWRYLSYKEMVSDNNGGYTWVAAETTNPLAKVLRFRSDPEKYGDTNLFLTWFQEGKTARSEDVVALYAYILAMINEVVALGNSEMAIIHSLAQADFSSFIKPNSTTTGYDRAKEIAQVRQEILSDVISQIAATEVIVKWITFYYQKNMVAFLVAGAEYEYFRKNEIFPVTALIEPSELKVFLEKNKTMSGKLPFADKLYRFLLSNYSLEELLKLEKPD